MRKLRRSLAAVLVRFLGTKIVDAQSGEQVGKALLIPWRGKIHVIGLERSVRAIFLPQTRVTYWKQEIGFSSHPSPDYPSIATRAGAAETAAESPPQATPAP